MKIVHYPDPILLKKTNPVIEFNKELGLQVKEMFQIMEQEKGVGLAANQVGLDKSIFVVKIPFVEQDLIRVFINPKISLSGDMVAINEGCLSFPDIQVEFPRFRTCTITYQNLDGSGHEETFSGIPSIVCQHEVDHLEGKTFIDNLPDLTKQQIRDKLADK